MLCVVGIKRGDLFSKKISIDHYFGRVFAAGVFFNMLPQIVFLCTLVK